jgi:hypothetical protein
MGSPTPGATDFDRARTLWFALLLTLTNGFMDAHTFYVRGGVFANVQTGNVIFFAIDVSERKVGAAMAHVWPIPRSWSASPWPPTSSRAGPSASSPTPCAGR